jgi:hypothetical protein
MCVTLYPSFLAPLQGGEPELAWSLSISPESIMTPKGATFWRKAGLNYLQYLNIATRTVRAGLKVWSALSVVEIGRFITELLFA